MAKVSPMKWILDEAGSPVECEDVVAWVEWFGGHDRMVARTELGGEKRVSTVFLGLDHNFTGIGAPLLWETIVFGRNNEELACARYGSREEAVAGHARLVERYAQEPATMN